MIGKVKSFYRISPALNGGKNSWFVELVTQLESGDERASYVGYFGSLRRAREVVAHFNRKPTEITARQTTVIRT